MGSISELCWTSAEDLFRELNLDSLYARQVGVLGPFASGNYPYLLLVNTGKITIGINLGDNSAEREISETRGRMAGQKIDRDDLFPKNYMEEQSD